MSKTESKPSSSTSPSRTGPASPHGSASTAQVAVGSPARTWQDLKVGSVVVAHENMEDGWFEAVVLSIAGDALTLRWRDYPKQPTITRHRSQIAFMAADK